jgi:tRNA/rRNA methyltransferase
MPSLAVDIVLVRPLRSANVAAACRAMKNMGLADLVLISPPAEIREPQARALAYGAWDVLDGARLSTTLEDAVARSTFVVGTSGKHEGEVLTPRQLAGVWRERTRGGRMSIVFGPESSGMTRAELGLCHAVVRIPTDDAHSSLNLAQAVLVLAYEIWVSSVDPEPEGALKAARVGELEEVLADLRGSLLAIGFLNPQNPDAILGEMRRLLARAGATERELALLRGMARQIRWASQRGPSAT